MRVVRLGVTRTGAALLAAAAIVAASSCSAPNAQVELSQAPAGSPTTPAVTMTVPGWRTVTHTLTVTTTMVTPTTVRATPTVTVTLPPRPAATSTVPFTKATALAGYAAIIRDIAALDVTGGAGSTAAIQFESLARHLIQLETMEAPPGLDPPSWFGRVISLRLFADAASAEALAGSPQAPARFAVIRSEVGVLLAMVNGALRTTLTLPPPASPTLR